MNINKFVKGARLFGLKEILLNNMVKDPSMIHERLAYWIGRQIGPSPPRFNHAWVTMNGTALGLYATVEEAKDTMMAYSFADASGGSSPSTTPTSPPSISPTSSTRTARTTRPSSRRR